LYHGAEHDTVSVSMTTISTEVYWKITSEITTKGCPTNEFQITTKITVDYYRDYYRLLLRLL